MKRVVTLLAAIVLILPAVAAAAPTGGGSFGGSLNGWNEVPSVSTSATGAFSATVNADGTAVDWSLRYSALEGAVQQAHLHFGNVGVNGGITVFLCTNLGNGPAGIATCPAGPTTISGTLVAADVSPNIPATAAARTQGIDTGEMDELIAALRAGVVYVNVHSTTWPGGEIRVQLDRGR
jgi:hypothetical protein